MYICNYKISGAPCSNESFREGKIAQREEKGEIAFRLFRQVLDAALRRNDRHCAACAIVALVENTSLFAPIEEGDHFEYRERLCVEAIEHFQAVGDQRGLADAMRLLAREKPVDQAKHLLENSLAIMRRLDDWRGVIKCLDALGHLECIEDNQELGQSLKHEAMEIARREADSENTAHMLFSIALTCSNDPQERIAMFEEAAELFGSLGHVSRQARALAYCAILGYSDYQGVKKEVYLQTAIQLCHQVGNRALAATCFQELAEIARVRGDEVLAADYDLHSHREYTSGCTLPKSKPDLTRLDREAVRDMIREELKVE